MTLRLVVCLLLTGVIGTAQQPSAPPSDQPSPARFGTATAGVVVDVVVRDGRGRPITDLTKGDFEVFEDGFAQAIVDFEPYAAADAPITAEDAATAAGLSSPGTPSARRLAQGPPVIALAWDRLSPEARTLAHRAAKRLVETKAPGELVGIFLTDLTLSTIQPYTTDTTKLLAAVEDLATRATSQQGREPSPLDTIVGRAQTPATAGPEESGYGLAGFSYYVGRTPERAPGAGDRPDYTPMTNIVQMLIRMEQSYLQFLYETQGRASMLGLLSLVGSLGELPGRKTVLYFCEGLTLPESQQARFRQVIEAANRNNVSVYTFDAAGLRVQSAQQQTAREIRELTFTALGPADSRSAKWSEELENNERLLKMDPAVSLSILASQTGGVLTNNTNALDRAIDHINDDRRHHYLLSYVPTNGAMDGTYRAIAVQVKRPGIHVRARRGYKAATSSAATPVLDYEEAPLAALAATPAPAAFPVALRAMHTPMPGRPGLVSVFMAFNARSLAIGRNEDGSQLYAGATVLARVVDEQKREVARASQQYELTGTPAERERLAQGAVLFFKTADLTPGRHRVEGAAHDRMAEQSATARAEVVVTPPAGAWLAGDLIVVARAEPIAPDAPGAATHPLVADGRLFTPEPVAVPGRTPRDTVSFVVPMLTFERDLSRVPATIELRRGDHVAARAELAIPEPGPDGRVMIVGRLPLAGVPPAEYELRLTVAGATRTATLRVTP